MIWFIVMQVLSTLLEWLSLGRKTNHQEKNLEILLLRRQPAILERKQDKLLRVSRAEKLPLVVLTTKVIHLPHHAPNSNAFAERWGRTVREECLGKLLIIDKRHLHHVMREYITHYNQQRPHQGIDQRSPIPFPTPKIVGEIHHRDVLGGIIHEYYRGAA